MKKVFAYPSRASREYKEDAFLIRQGYVERCLNAVLYSSSWTRCVLLTKLLLHSTVLIENLFDVLLKS